MHEFELGDAKIRSLIDIRRIGIQPHRADDRHAVEFQRGELVLAGGRQARHEHVRGHFAAAAFGLERRDRRQQVSRAVGRQQFETLTVQGRRLHGGLEDGPCGAGAGHDDLLDRVVRRRVCRRGGHRAAEPSERDRRHRGARQKPSSSHALPSLCGADIDHAAHIFDGDTPRLTGKRFHISKFYFAQEGVSATNQGAIGY